MIAISLPWITLTDMPILREKAAVQRLAPTSVLIHIDVCGLIYHQGQQSLFDIRNVHHHSHVVELHTIWWLEIPTRRQKYLGSVITGEGSKPEVLSRISQTTAALTRLKPDWIDKSISLSSKIRLMRSLVTSIFLYACESWTLTAELQRRIRAMEMRCYRRILRIPHKDNVTYEEIRA